MAVVDQSGQIGEFAFVDERGSIFGVKARLVPRAWGVACATCLPAIVHADVYVSALRTKACRYWQKQTEKLLSVHCTGEHYDPRSINDTILPS